MGLAMKGEFLSAKPIESEFREKKGELGTHASREIRLYLICLGKSKRWIPMKWQRIRLFLKLIFHFSERCKIAVTRRHDQSDLIGEAMF